MEGKYVWCILPGSQEAYGTVTLVADKNYSESKDWFTVYDVTLYTF